MDGMSLYLAGGVFNAAERIHNLFLERSLTDLNWPVIVPQWEALKFLNPKTGHLNLKGVARDCRSVVENPKNICVACTDGPDADAGTAVEYGHAITATGRAIVYRTDFRTAPEHELGVNAMFRQEGTHYIYCPCLVRDLGGLKVFYDKLAGEIDRAARLIIAREEK